MKNNLKEKTKLRCNDSPRKEDIGKIFEYENIIDKEKVHKKMKQSVRQGKSDKAPGWFTEWVHENKKEETLYRKEQNRKEDERWAKQYAFNEQQNKRWDKQEKFNKQISKRVEYLFKHVNFKKK
ncbi:MAG: hypothetical protein Ta2E_05110 [Mycoplasmoidaceae bacterium]|nr:MAG: hypothetical protein Ta2E_05110 [Mycoplasmoidaceae bacterium]